MNHLEAPRSRRSRTRNLVAVAVMWAGLATFAVTDSASAMVDTRPTVDSDERRAAAGGRAAQGLSILTAERAPVTGVAPDGTQLNGTFKLRRFVERRGVLYAVGRLNGVLGTSLVNQSVQLPVTGASNGAPEPEGFLQPDPTPGACDILTLNLGPLDLDLLGLRVALDPVNLLIEAIPGAGNLLGNLLCGVAGLLDGGLGSGLGGLLSDLLAAIANLLNGLLGA
jgi:hypothetical protein